MDTINLATLFLGALTIFVLSILLHEIGHYVLIRCFGYTPTTIRFGDGPEIHFSQTLGKTTIEWRGVMCGEIVIPPGDENHFSLAEWLICLAGGPLINLLLFSLSWFLSDDLSLSELSDYNILETGLFLTFWINVVTFTLHIIPEGCNDGAQFLRSVKAKRPTR